MQHHDDKRDPVVILGGSYAGQGAAAALARKKLPVRITVVDMSDRFVERIRLHQVAAGEPLRMRPLIDQLPRGVAFQRGKVVGIDLEARQVHLEADGQPLTLPYRWLVYALGSQTDRQRVPGVAEHAWTLDGWRSSQQTGEQLKALAARGGRVAVAGNGLTGIEVATELAERYPSLKVSLLGATPLGADLSEAGAAHVRQVCGRLGIEVLDQVRVLEVEEKALRLAGGAAHPFDLCLWTAGFSIAPLAREAGLPVTSEGWIETAPDLRAVGLEEVFAAGDAAEVAGAGGRRLRMSCAASMPQGRHVGENLARLIRGEPLLPFRFGFLARCISLGRQEGLVQFVAPDDTPLPRIWTGRRAVMLKELICQMTVMVTWLEARTGLRLYQWPQPRQNALPAPAGPAGA